LGFFSGLLVQIVYTVSANLSFIFSLILKKSFFIFPQGLQEKFFTGLDFDFMYRYLGARRSERPSKKVEKSIT